MSTRQLQPVLPEMSSPALDAGELFRAEKFSFRWGLVVCSVAYPSCIELEVNIGLTSFALHEELDAAVFVDIVPISRRERAEVLAIDDIGDVECLGIIAQIDSYEWAVREVRTPVQRIDIEHFTLLSQDGSELR